MMHSINRAAFEALEKHWITSATILVPCPWLPEVAQFARSHPEVDFGIHLALNSEWPTYRWGPVSPRALVPSLLDADGYFPPLEADVVRQAKPAEVELELRAQIEKARAAGIRVTHLDSHMGTLFASQQLLETYRKLGREYGLPILLPRSLPHAKEMGIGEADFSVDREIQMRPGVPPGEWMQEYKKMLGKLPQDIYQLTVHLGYDDEESRGAAGDRNWGGAWRQRDLEIISSPEFREFLRAQGFQLVAWKDLSGPEQ